MDKPSWPTLAERKELLVDFCQDRTVALPIAGEKRGMVVRYRTGDRIMWSGSVDEYDDDVYFAEWRFGVKNLRALYASNEQFITRKPSFDELLDQANIRAYMGYIDIDNVAADPALGKKIIKELLAKLPPQGVWACVSGSGVHININGFKSWAHAQTFLKSCGIPEGRYPDDDSHIKIDHLMSRNRIGTVPYSVYKKDPNILCFPFMPDEVGAVFDRPDWRAYYPTHTPRPWRLPSASEVEAWNEKPMDDLETGKRRKYVAQPGPAPGTVKVDARFWSSLPPCVIAAFFNPLRGDAYRCRIMLFLASFMRKVGVGDDDLLLQLYERNDRFDNPEEDDVVEEMADKAFRSDLEPPGCGKLRWKSGGGFPFLNLAELGFCPHGKDPNVGCVRRSPRKMFELVRGDKRG